MGATKIIFFVIFLAIVVYVMVLMYKNSLKNEISQAERAVEEYFKYKECDITSLISKQKEIRLKGIHVGIKIKARVKDKEGKESEFVLVHNSLSNDIKVLDETSL